MTPFVYAQISILHLFCEAVVHTNIHRDTLETMLYPPRIGFSELHVLCVSPSSSADRLAIALPPAPLSLLQALLHPAQQLDLRAGAAAPDEETIALDTTCCCFRARCLHRYRHRPFLDDEAH